MYHMGRTSHCAGWLAVPYVCTDAMKGTSPKKRDSGGWPLRFAYLRSTPIDDSTIAAASRSGSSSPIATPCFGSARASSYGRQRDCLVVGEAETAEQTVALRADAHAAIVLLDSALSGSAIVLTVCTRPTSVRL
jgi:hypothetical protein